MKAKISGQCKELLHTLKSVALYIKYLSLNPYNQHFEYIFSLITLNFTSLYRTLKILTNKNKKMQINVPNDSV